MSINKILNRPMFRETALKKGHLKPVHARIGLLVGAPTRNIQATRNMLPAINQQGFYGRNIRPLFQRAGQDIKGFTRRPGQFFTTQSLRKTPGIATARLLGIEGLIRPISAVTSKLGMEEGTTKDIVDFGLAGLAGFTPIGRAAGLALTGANVILGAKDYASGQEIGTSADAMFKPDLGESLNLFTPIDSTKRKGRKRDPKRIEMMKEQIAENRQRLIDRGQTNLLSENRPKGRRANVLRRMELLKQKKAAEVDVATEPQNTTKVGDKEVIDTAKIAENALPPQLGDRGLSMDDMSGVQTTPPGDQKPKGDIKTDAFGFPKKNLTQGQKDVATDKSNKDTVTAQSPVLQALEDAKVLAAEMRKGRASQAQLTFLANLASGLLTGTTTKAGVGGALEVFGKALGPAVNNMIMVKMKEDELDQNLLGRALEFQADFLKAQNDAFEMPQTESVGVIQIPNANGRIVNVPGRILKDGTKQRATGEVTAAGVNIYQTVDPSLNFIPNKDQNKETLEIAGDLAGKYAALNLINRSLGIITAEDATADAGVIGAIGLYGGRLTEALGDVFKFTKPSGNTKSELKQSGKVIFDIEREKAAMRLVNGGEFEDKKSALKALDSSLGSFEKNYRSALADAKDRLKGGGKLDYERLAINETVLVYKLANSLKSKDRLTQKDIEMAKNLVKVFPLLRGEENVIASLTATAETILDDIRQQERLYERAGGSSQYLLNERRAYGLTTSDTLNTMTDLESQKLEKFKQQIPNLTEEQLQLIFPPELFDR